MAFKNDKGGIALSLKNSKISCGSASTWATKLSQIERFKGNIFIMTYSLPNLEYSINKIFRKKSMGVSIMCHERFSEKAIRLKNEYPSIRVWLRNDIHAKFILIEPATVWVSSANFGSSGYIEAHIGLHSEMALSYFRDIFLHLCAHALEVEGSDTQ